MRTAFDLLEKPLCERVARTGGEAVAALRQTADRHATSDGRNGSRRQEARTWGSIRRLQLTGPMASQGVGYLLGTLSKSFREWLSEILHDYFGS
jgi:hypothetical protein